MLEFFFIYLAKAQPRPIRQVRAWPRSDARSCRWMGWVESAKRERLWELEIFNLVNNFRWYVKEFWTTGSSLKISFPKALYIIFISFLRFDENHICQLVTSDIMSKKILAFSYHFREYSTHSFSFKNFSNPQFYENHFSSSLFGQWLFAFLRFVCCVFCSGWKFAILPLFLTVFIFAFEWAARIIPRGFSAPNIQCSISTDFGRVFHLLVSQLSPIFPNFRLSEMCLTTNNIQNFDDGSLNP